MRGAQRFTRFPAAAVMPDYGPRHQVGPKQRDESRARKTMTHRDLWLIAFGFYVFAFPSIASAYDGPAGVTSRAPLIEKPTSTGSVVLEGMSVREEVRVDQEWSLETKVKGCAFATQTVTFTSLGVVKQ